ncbi:MFS transporter [Galbitalea sp. SE-J8]|uniref:MFS transporter n=1 Tax=Galbitalea sp. SE-J8 TaxID=3054952 RepID=UPI00259D2C5A|nr:MFS transporter [Galbitalea sp. SE-J8]MDM4763296.1 MFS transporter [Galbitalea sp. SE-J8]
MSVSTASIPVVPASRRRAISQRASFVGISITLVAFFVAAGAPAPLLGALESRWGFPTWELGVAFSAYAFALLLTLLVVGSLSDHLGRRPVLIGSLALELVALAVFFAAGSVEWLIVARVLQGIATGGATAAFTAAVIEFAPAHRKRLGAIIGGAAPAGGLGLGALIAGGLESVTDATPQLVFGSLAIVMVAGVIVAALSAETVTPVPGALASLRPHLAIPRAARGTFRRVVPTVLAAWMVPTLFIGLLPTVLAGVFGIHDTLVGGVISFLQPGAAAIAGALTGGRRARSMLVLAPALVAVGALGIILGIALVALPVLVLGGIVGGSGFGIGFSAALRELTPLAQPHERAGLFAGLYLVSYLAFGVPAVVATALVAPLGVLPVALGFGAVILLAAGIGLAAQLLPRR